MTVIDSVPSPPYYVITFTFSYLFKDAFSQGGGKALENLSRDVLFCVKINLNIQFGDYCLSYLYGVL